MGGALYLSGASSVNVNRSVFQNGFAFTSGGAIYLRSFTEFKISHNTKFTKNRAVISGGDIYAVESQKNLQLQDVII